MATSVSASGPDGTSTATCMPGMGDILVIGASGHAAASIGARLAARDGSLVTGCEMPVEFLRGRQWGGEPVLSLMTTSPAAQRVEDLAEGHPGHEFCAAALQLGAGAAYWAVMGDDNLHALKQLCSWHDLVIVQRPADSASRPLSGLEALVLHTGLPVLLLPARISASATFDRVAVAWDGSIPATRALRASLPFCVAARDVLLLDGSPSSRAEPRFDPQAFFARYGVDVARHRVHTGSSGADHLMRHVRSEGADLVVMGAYSHPPLTERWFGGVTRDVLRSSDIAVLLHH